MQLKNNRNTVLHRAYDRFIKIRGHPREIALGFALGIFIGMTPTMGVQTPLAVFLAAMFKWSKLAAGFGVWITNPLTAPFIYGFNYLVGANLIGQESAFAMPDELTWAIVKDMIQKAPRMFGALTVGGIVLGLPAAAVSYYVSYRVLDKYQMNMKEKLARQKARLANTKAKVKSKIKQKRMKN